MLKYSYIVYKNRRHVHISDNKNNKSLLIVKDDAVWRLVLVDWWMFSKNMASLINLQLILHHVLMQDFIKMHQVLISMILLKWYMFIKGISYSFLNKLYWGHWKSKYTSSSTFVGQNLPNFDQLVFLLYHIYQFLSPENMHWFLILSTCVLNL